MGCRLADLLAQEAVAKNAGIGPTTSDGGNVTEGGKPIRELFV